MSVIGGELIFNTSLDNKDFINGLDRIRKKIKNFSKFLAGAIVIKEIFDFGKESVQIASDLQEIQNVVDVAFGEMSYIVDEFSKTALEKFGMSELSVKKTAGMFGAMAKGMGLAQEQATEMALTLTGLTGDFSSFYNVSQDMANTAISAVFTGETETLKRYGIIMTDVSLQSFALANGIQKSVTKMTQLEKTMLRYNYILNATALAQGDFLRTSDSFANQTRVLSERFKELLSILGSGLIQAFTPFVKFLNNILDNLIKFFKTLSAVFAELFGKQKQTTQQTNKQESSINNAVQSQQDLNKEIGKTNKTLKKSLLSFDEIEKLTKDTADTETISPNLGIGSGNFTPQVTIKPELEVDTTQIDKIKKTLLKFIKPLTEINFEPLRKSFNKLMKAISPFTRALFVGLEWAYFNLFIPLSKFTIEKVLPLFFDILAESLNILYMILEPFIPLFIWFFDNILMPLAKWTGEKFINALTFIRDRLINISNWMSENKTLVQIMTDLVLSFFLAWKIKGILEFIKNSGGLIKVFSNLKSSIFGTINSIKLLGKAFINLMGNPYTLIALGIVALIFIIIQLIRNWDKVQEVANKVLNAIVQGWSQFKYFAQNSILAPFVNIVDTIFNISGRIKNIFGNLIDFVRNVFTGNWSGAWQNVVNIFGNIFGGIADLAKMPINFVIDIINLWVRKITKFMNWLISMLNKIKLPDWLGGFGINIPQINAIQIPRLAKGGVIPPNKEFFAILGDQKRGTNIEAPLETIKDGLRQVFKEQSFDTKSEEKNVTVVLKIGETEFARQIVNLYEKGKKFKGSKLITD